MTQATDPTSATFVPPADYMGENRVPPHAPQLYSPDSIAEVHSLNGNSLTPDQVESYRRDGFLAVGDFFNESEVEGARQALTELAAGLNPKFTNFYAEAGGQQLWAKLPIEKRQDVIRKLADFTKFDVRLQLHTHPRMVSVMSQLVNGEPRLFQEMALIKPPKLGREKPWHQDHAYFAYTLDTPIVGAWIALDEATIANGCMHVVRGGNHGPAHAHFNIRDWQMCDREMLSRTCTAVPLKPGGVLFFSSLTPHGTPTNFSEQRRRALQFHYIGPVVKEVPREEHSKTWGGAAQNMTC